MNGTITLEKVHDFGLPRPATTSQQRNARWWFRRWDDNSHDKFFAVIHFLSLCPPTVITLDALRIVLTSDNALSTKCWICLGILLRFCIIFHAILDFVWRVPAFLKPKKRRRLRLQGQDVPRVDVIITACREATDVVLDTVKATCTIDYPQDRFRIIVADDGADPKLRSLIDDLSLTYPNLHYFARCKTPGINHKFKAGNINSTLAWTSFLPSGPAEWFAVLDCDMMPEPEWLRVLLAHALQDPLVAMAVPPQGFYNLPRNDPLYQNTDVQFAIDDRLRDALDGTWCSGSGFLARRAAIDCIGGFADSSLSEDILCSMKLNAQGWRVMLVEEKLQWGLMPESIDAHVSQRKRWAVGTLQNALQLRFCLDRRLVPRMTAVQRFQGFVYSVTPLFGYLLRPLAALVLPWCLVMGHANVITPTPAYLRYQLFWNLVGRLLYLVKEVGDMKWASPRAVRQRGTGFLWLGPIISGDILDELLFGRKRQSPTTFISSGSIKSSLAERDATARAPLRDRLWKILFGEKYRNCTLLAVNAVLCFAIRVSLDLRAKGTGGGLLLMLCRNSFSPTFGWEEYVAFVVPLVYILFPPSMPERREMMRFEKRSGTWRARDECTGVRWDGWSLLLEMPGYVALVWSALALWIIQG